ncbi:hypothetical protein [Candidatus Neptunochlamydia vexilliferae]|nr:hypothetical protein [Candidatus Neptunochlamydia vexilliferae]
MAITPQQAFAERSALKKELEAEYAHFLALAAENPGLALQYFMTTVVQTGLNYADSETLIFASAESAMSVLNNDVAAMQSSFNNMISILKNNPDDTGWFEAQANAFTTEANTYCRDLNKYFGPNGPFKGQSSFYNTAIDDLNAFTVPASITGGQPVGFGTYLAEGKYHPGNQHTPLSEAIAAQVKQAYESSINMSGTGDGGAQLKAYGDVMSKLQMLQGQLSGQIVSDLQFDEKMNQQYLASVAGMYKDNNTQKTFMVQKQTPN